MKRYPDSPRAQYGKAEALFVVAESEKSNPRLEEGIKEVEKVRNTDVNCENAESAPIG